ncbi:MAG: BspA family leucine-rich repeat surface protein [Bacteroidales bacterium]|nr:BspA family leucine-rich repeat surface protein [Bacteroidales bacterium]
MKLKLFFPAAVAAMLLLLTGGCAEKYPDPDHYVGIIKTGFTRTSYSPEGIQLKGKWDTGDRILVKGASSNATVTLTAASSGTEVDFFAEGGVALPQPPCRAYYPADADGVIPVIQHYSPNGPAEVPMIAGSITRYLEFSPACALLELKVTSRTGDIQIKEISIDSGYVLDCGEGVAVGSSPVSFWFAVPEGKLTGATIDLTTADGKTGRFTLAEGESMEMINGEVTTCNMVITSLEDHSVPNIACLPNGLNFNRFIKSAARPDADWRNLVAALADSLITSVTFVTEDPRTSDIRIDDGGVAPIYVFYDSSSGAITVTTPAKQYRLHEYCAYMFRNLYSLEKIDFGNMAAPLIINMTYMFYNCEKLESLDLSFMDTGGTFRMEYAFANCKALKSLNVSSFNTSQVTSISYMFSRCESLTVLDLSNFNLRKVPASAANYSFHALLSLRELRVGEDFICSDGGRPSSIFVNTNTPFENRPGHNGDLKIYTVQSVADWLAITNLRWVHSGHSGQKPIDVSFYDIKTGDELTVTWAAN